MSDNIARVLDTLRKQKPVQDYGVWEIYGEDPNCDFGGHHHTPLLIIVEGSYEDAIQFAVTQKGFFQWGSGGHLKFRNMGPFLKVPTETQLTDILNRKKELEAELTDIKLRYNL